MALLDLALITAMCLPLYALGATAIGLVNDQEGFRATAAREMHARGDWILPTLRGEPYLAKPPMIYWIQLSIARVRGAAPDLFDLRITAALAGWLGVVATYLAAGRFARGTGADPRSALGAARWSAAGLAVGILFVRSARSGEIDILLVPWVVVAIGALAAAWDFAATRGRTHWPAIAIAMICGAGAALTKGPVPLGVIGITLVGAILVDAARSAPSRAPAIIGALVGMFALGAVSGASAVSWGDAPGVLAHAILGGIAGAVLGAAASPRVTPVWAPALLRCHLELVLGAGVLAIWAWGQAVKSRIGPDAVQAAASRELEDNLRFLVPESPINNLEFLAYGLMPITICAIDALISCIRDRARPTRTGLILVAWIVGGFILFSAAGKGVARYLTPIWPAIAMVGGIWIATGMRRWADQRGAWRWVRAVCVITIVMFGCVQGAWYIVARPMLFTLSASRSPRDLASRIDVPPDRLGIWDFSPLTFEYHWGHTVERWNTKSFDAMVQRIRSDPGDYYLLAQEENDRVVNHRGSVRTLLTNAGFAWERIGDDSDVPWVHDPGATPVELVRIHPGPP